MMPNGWLCAAKPPLKKRLKSSTANSIAKDGLLHGNSIPFINYKYLKQTKLSSYFKAVEKADNKNKKKSVKTVTSIHNNQTKIIFTDSKNSIVDSKRDCYCSILHKTEFVTHKSDYGSSEPVQYSKCIRNSDTKWMDVDCSSIGCPSDEFSPCVLADCKELKPLKISWKNNDDENFEYKGAKNISSSIYEESSNHLFHARNNIKNIFFSNYEENVKELVFTKSCHDYVKELDSSETEAGSFVDLTLNPPSPIIFTEQFSELPLNGNVSQPPSPLSSDSCSTLFDDTEIE